MAARIMFIHGAWLTPLCWDNWVQFFSARGYSCIAPPWPFHEWSVPVLRADPPAGLKRLGIAEIIDKYAARIRIEKTPPILIGHSFGGLFVQVLLSRGLGAAGVAIDPAAPRGVSPVRFSSVKATAPFLFTWGAWWKEVQMSLPMFKYAFANGLPQEYQEREFRRHIVPESGRIFFQTLFAPFIRRSPIAISFANTSRRPLLIIAGGTDTIVPASVNRANHKRYVEAGVPTGYKEFPGRCHWTIAHPGWDEVAEYAAQWLEEHADGAENKP
jgi:pimeloyl-ACP methyl ester carboxylesterase